MALYNPDNPGSPSPKPGRAETTMTGMLACRSNKYGVFPVSSSVNEMFITPAWVTVAGLSTELLSTTQDFQLYPKTTVN